MKKTFTLFIALLFANTFYSQSSSCCIIADLPFSGNAEDISYNNTNGIVYGATLTTDRFGNENSAYYFDGIDDYIELNAVVDVDEIKDFTICVWAYLEDWQIQEATDGLLDRQYIFDGATSSNTVTSDFYKDGFRIMYDYTEYNEEQLHNTIIYDGNDVLNNYLAVNNDLDIKNKWHFIVWMREGLQDKTFIDGVEINVNYISDDHRDSPLNMQHSWYIGTTLGNNPNYNELNYNFHGKIDDIKIYRCALSDEEVADLYEPADTTTCLVLQPNAEDGKDAKVHSLGTYTSGDAIEFEAQAWTYDGTPGIERCLIEFDLDTIPENAIINDAKLSLFDPYHSVDSHSTLSGSNASVLQRIIEPWEENSVTWENQPSTTEQNQIILPEISEDHQDMLDINVTQLIQDMLDNKDESYGFLIKLITEEYYRAMIFASSDHEDTSKHPKLEICYTTNTINIESEQADKNSLGIKIYPNPTNNVISIEANELISDIQIFDINGKLVLSKNINSNKKEINTSSLTQGVYFINIKIKDSIITKKFIKQK